VFHIDSTDCTVQDRCDESETGEGVTEEASGRLCEEMRKLLSERVRVKDRGRDLMSKEVR
jgi:hypothetical protein